MGTISRSSSDHFEASSRGKTAEMTQYFPFLHPREFLSVSKMNGIDFDTRLKNDINNIML